MELEWLACLADPAHVVTIVPSLSKPGFLAYLQHLLRCYTQPAYASLLTHPGAIDVLRALISGDHVFAIAIAERHAARGAR